MAGIHIVGLSIACGVLRYADGREHALYIPLLLVQSKGDAIHYLPAGVKRDMIPVLSNLFGTVPKIIDPRTDVPKPFEKQKNGHTSIPTCRKSSSYSLRWTTTPYMTKANSRSERFWESLSILYNPTRSGHKDMCAPRSWCTLQACWPVPWDQSERATCPAASAEGSDPG